MNPLKNKGMFLEEVLDITHSKYNEQQLCIVSKIPINIKLNNVENKKITKAIFIENDNCDYIGNFIGRYFEFEAKETSKNFFNWFNIQKNQIKKLNEILATNGLAFLIIYFSSENKFFLVDFALLQFAVNNNGKKIPLEWFEQNAFELFITSELKLDYLQYFNSLTNWI